MVSINIAKALAIEGWMEPEELTWLAKAASTHHRIVELGSHQGRSTRALADHTPGKVIAIDGWEHETPEAYSQFQNNLCDHLASGKVIQSRILHENLRRRDMLFGEQDPDMIFIDGSHDYKSVHDTLLLVRDVACSGTMLCGHDFGVHCPGVVRAVFDDLSNPRQAPGTTIWYQEMQ